MQSPVSTCENAERRAASQNGSATNASIWEVNDATEVPIDSANTGIRSRSTGRSGAGCVSWRRTKK